MAWAVCPPVYISGTGTYDVTIDYTALDDRDVVAAFYTEGWSLNREMKQTVAPGSGTAIFSFTPSGNPPPGAYHWKGEIRPQGGIWSDSFKDIYQNVTVDDPAVPAPGTLLDGSGEVMRGTPLVLGKNLPASVAFAENIDTWNLIKSHDLNSVRVCWVDPWYKANGHGSWTVSEVLPHLDAVVNNAETAGMNVVINYHCVGNPDFTLLNEFWTAVAPRYKDQSFVYYEIANEPTFDYNTWTSQAFEDGIKAAYDIVRAQAPNRQILLFSFNTIGYDLKSIVDQYASWIDWPYTTIAYHLYGGNDTYYVENLINNYRSVCTEWDYYGHFDYIRQYYNQYYNSQTLEQFGSGWFDWRDWGDTTLDEITGKLIPDAHAKGYWWGS
ncbi:MAG: cellulase family glycosylhydrolase [Spirochaetales bacterium]|nr:cellulase family glycosylhydrolase [Spirochaetales bacterium]